MSFTSELLLSLSRNRSGINQKPSLLSSRAVSNSTLRVTLSRLKKRGFVHNRSGWNLTAKGKAYIADKLNFHRKPATVPLQTEKRIIVAFDIPEKYRRKRRWLRFELGLLGFTKLQESVWIGPPPLPKDFIADLHNLSLLTYIKFFEAKENDIV